MLRFKKMHLLHRTLNCRHRVGLLVEPVQVQPLHLRPVQPFRALLRALPSVSRGVPQSVATTKFKTPKIINPD